MKSFYADNNLDLQKMVLFTSDGASVMLGKNNGVAARLRHEIKHLSEQHCVAHKEDFAIDDAWKQVSIMHDIETLLRTVYTMFHRSSVRKEQFQEIADITDCDALAFRPLNEVRWLSRHFAVKALIRNYDALIEYCTEKVEHFNDPINKYCLNPQYRVAIAILNEVLGDLAALTNLFQRSGLTSLEALQFAKATINKLKSQYLSNVVYWSDNIKKVLALLNTDVDTTAIIRFIELLCKHLESRFPEEEFIEWHAFDPGAIANTTNFEFGKESVLKLVRKYSTFLPDFEYSVEETICQQYITLKFIVAEKYKSGSIQTFTDLVNFVLRDDQFKELTFLLDISSTFLASSSDCERGFSLMNAIKTKSRNRIEVNHLECLMRIKSHILSQKVIDLDNVYQYWASEKDRREKLL